MLDEESSSPAEPVTIRHVAALDGLRGMAVAGVLVFHGGLSAPFIFDDHDRTESVRLGKFWARRARRLLPALGGVLVGVALYALVVAKPDELRQIRGDALATIGYVANWRAVFAQQDYWALFRTPSPLQHTWSLAIEEQFYLVWPLVFVGLLAWWKRAAPKAVLVTALVLAGVSGVLTSVFWDPLDPSRSYYGTDTRAAAVLLGAALASALAIWGPVRGRVGRTVLEAIGFAGVATLAVAWTSLDGQSSGLYHGGLFLCGIAATAVIAASVHPTSGLISRALSFRPICLLGLISYGVYLWHWPVYIVFDDQRLGIEGWTLLAARFAITIAIAIASYRLLEQPIRHGAFTAHQWRFLTPALAAGVVVVLFATTSGAPPVVSTSTADAISRETAHANAAPPGTQRLLVIGDSVAHHLAEGFHAFTAQPPVITLNQAVIACTFPSGAEAVNHDTITSLQRDYAVNCDDDWKTAVDRFDPDLVLLVFWTPGDASYKYNGTWMQPCDAAYDAMYERDLATSARSLGARGAHVAIANSPYAVREETNPGARHRIDCVNRIQRRLAREQGVQLVDLFHFVCPRAPKCLTSVMNTVLRPDTVHFTDAGARLVDRWLLAQMRTEAPPGGPPRAGPTATDPSGHQAISARSGG